MSSPTETTSSDFSVPMIILDEAAPETVEPTKTKKRKREGKASKPDKKPKKKKTTDETKSSIKNSSAHKKLKFLAVTKEQQPNGELKDEGKALKKLKEINKLNEKTAQEQVDLEQTKASASVASRLSMTLRTIVGGVIDGVLKGDGEIADRVNNDEALNEAMSTELLTVAQYLNNRARIAGLVSMDVFHGKRAALLKQRLEEPTPVNIVEVVEQPQEPVAEPEPVPEAPAIPEAVESKDMSI
jgi:hypothetical protein